jgi:hypothetical protein
MARIADCLAKVREVAAMSATAQKRSVPPPVPPHVLHRSHGPVIDASRHRTTLLPPPNPTGNADGRVPALSELVEQLVDASDAAEIDSDVAEAPELQDTIVPDSGIVECAARLSAEPSLASQSMVAAHERAELDIQDYSLRLDNPYALSSLVPPKRRHWGRTALLVVTGAVAAAVASLAGSTMLPRAPAAPRNTEHQPSVAIVHAAPVSPAPMLPQGPVGADSVTVTPPVTVNPTEPPTPAAGAEIRASKFTLAQPRTPRGPRRTRARGRHKASPMIGHDAPAAALPMTPTREQVFAGFSQVRGELARCAGGKTGVVEIQATILSSGRISTAMIGGAFEGTAEGSCMAQAARLASFGPFSQPMLKVRFPMAL